MFKDLSGQTFGYLYVVKRCENIKGRTAFLCRCKCGKEIKVISHSLMRGNTSSCGCLHKQQLAERNYKHGARYTRLYRIYRNMITRCYNSNILEYKNYGGRGIIVCKEWRESFVAFRTWAENNNYSDKLTIDRIDTNGNYEPNNCRWVTLKAQGFNKTNTKYFEYNGQKKCLAEWAEIFGIKKSTLYNRVYGLGWDIKKALETKVNSK